MGHAGGPQPAGPAGLVGAGDLSGDGGPGGTGVTGRPAAAGAPQPLRRRLGLVFLLGGLSAFGPLSLDMYLPAFPALGAELHAAPSHVQLTLTACLVGLATGQLVAGPASDARGRRRPLLVGLAGYALGSALCAAAPSIWALVALRLCQGFAGAAGIVIARAVVRDRYAGVEAARYFAVLTLVVGLAPVGAPLLGAALLRVTTWRGIFLVLAGIGALLLAGAAAGLAETLPPPARRTGGLRATGAVLRALLSDRAFVSCIVAAGLAFAGMFGYIAGSSFVLQEMYRLSPQGFGLVFAVNSCGIVGAGQASRFLVRRTGPLRLLGAGVIGAAAGGVALLVAVLAGAGLPGILPALFLAVASVGMVAPNAAALAMAGHPQTAGSASALLGATVFVIGGLVAPLVGVAGTGTALPMAVIIAAADLAALAAFTVTLRARR
jgi:MFS transporter, DHA1 family, multidrug resistance protein